jgi:hypothetical protein
MMIMQPLVVQNSNMNESVKTYKMMNGREVIAKIIKNEGWKGFYSGLSVNIVRGIGGALLLVLYDEMKMVLRY